MKHFKFFCLLLFGLSTVQAFGLDNSDTLKIGYYKTAPFIHQSNNGLAGVNIWLWNKIQEEFPTPHQLVEIPLESLVDSLSTGAIDISIVPLTITNQRSQTVDFSPPYFIAYSAVLVPSASTTKKMLLAAASFFNIGFAKAVGALFVIILVFGFLLWLFEKRGNEDEFDSGVNGIWDGVWWSAVTMTTVGYGDKSPKTVGGKIIATIWMFVAIMIISGFTAAITSSLTVSQLSWNYSEISDFKDKELGTISNSATEKWLNNNFFNNLSLFASTQEAMDAISQEKIDAIAYDNPALQYLISEEENSQFEVLPIDYNEQMYAFGFAENLDPNTAENISNALLKITESHDWTVLLSEYGLLDDD